MPSNVYQALGQYIIILPDALKEETNESGIITTTATGAERKAARKATVQSVGEAVEIGVDNDNNSRIIYLQGAASELEIEGVTYLVIRPDSVVAVLPKSRFPGEYGG
jgi:co-chaperonin GroES (HSP10)